jgi:hypothetical protein
MFVMVLAFAAIEKELAFLLPFSLESYIKFLHIQRTNFVFLEEISLSLSLSIESNRL